MVSQHVKIPVFQKVSEVLDGQVDSQQLAIVRAVACLSWHQSSRKNCPLMCCCKTAPTAASEASVMTLVGALGIGWTSSVALARACLTLSKDAVVSSVHGGESDGRFVCLRRECSGCKIAAPPGMNL